MAPWEKSETMVKIKKILYVLLRMSLDRYWLIVGSYWQIENYHTNRRRGPKLENEAL